MFLSALYVLQARRPFTSGNDGKTTYGRSLINKRQQVLSLWED
jgi:hypothetical protein